MNGVADDYFQLKWRKDLLLNVLFVWSFQNRIISYRQGMHEIVAVLLYTLEIELQIWKLPNYKDGYLEKAFTEQNLEAHTYWLFTR